MLSTVTERVQDRPLRRGRLQLRPCSPARRRQDSREHMSAWRRFFGAAGPIFPALIFAGGTLGLAVSLPDPLRSSRRRPSPFPPSVAGMIVSVLKAPAAASDPRSWARLPAMGGLDHRRHRDRNRVLRHQKDRDVSSRWQRRRHRERAVNAGPLVMVTEVSPMGNGR